MGCKQVFTMLFEASDEADPASFKETKLFKKCQEMGIIPRSKADLEQQAQTQESATSYPSTHRDIGSLDTQGEISDENALGLNLVVTDMWCPACAWVIELEMSLATSQRTGFSVNTTPYPLLLPKLSTPSMPSATKH
jgi:hypothetical protein